MPDLVVVPVGSTVSFPNMDPIFHNIYSLSKPRTFDLGSYDKGETRKVMFPKPGIVDVYCHLHPNMAATIVVTPNRWYARPDRSGQFESRCASGSVHGCRLAQSRRILSQQNLSAKGHDAVADFFIPIEEAAKVGGPR